jgi:hypothetical protein
VPCIGINVCARANLSQLRHNNDQEMEIGGSIEKGGTKYDTIHAAYWHRVTFPQKGTGRLNGRRELTGEACNPRPSESHDAFPTFIIEHDRVPNDSRARGR